MSMETPPAQESYWSGLGGRGFDYICPSSPWSILPEPHRLFLPDWRYVRVTGLPWGSLSHSSMLVHSKSQTGGSSYSKFHSDLVSVCFGPSRHTLRRRSPGKSRSSGRETPPPITRTSPRDPCEGLRCDDTRSGAAHPR